ncbi:MAG TPA: hypothetical protein PL152_03935 [Steroidobacteraceae bacterium]|nr:hypothetical protein [Steroidobacteraceae bacterium]
MRIPTLVAGLALVTLAGCGKAPAPPAAEAPADTTAAAPATPADTAAADAARAAELAAKEKELAEREAALKQQEVEQELARRNAEAAAAQQAAARKPAPKPAPARTTTASTQPQAKPVPPPPPPPLVAPAGTQLAIELTSPVSTKTATVGSAVQGRLASDLVIGGRLAAAAGSTVTGTVTQVVSGSKKIGGTPTLGITFDRLVAGTGGPVAMSARFVQQAASDTGKDTAKVVGTTAAGAIIGHQVSHKNGAIVGGVLGGAAGLAIAQNTGGEVSLASGTVVTVSLDGSIQFPPG